MGSNGYIMHITYLNYVDISPDAQIVKNRPFFTFLDMFQCKSLRKPVLDMAANRAALI